MGNNHSRTEHSEASSHLQSCNPFASLLPVRTAQRLVQNVTSFLEFNNRLLADFAMLSDDAIFTISVLSKPSFAKNRALA
jgi:hypothetical protein